MTGNLNVTVCYRNKRPAVDSCSSVLHRSGFGAARDKPKPLCPLLYSARSADTHSLWLRHTLPLTRVLAGPRHMPAMQLSTREHTGCLRAASPTLVEMSWSGQVHHAAQVQWHVHGWVSPLLELLSVQGSPQLACTARQARSPRAGSQHSRSRFTPLVTERRPPQPALPPQNRGADGEGSKEREGGHDAAWPGMQRAGPTLPGWGAVKWCSTLSSHHGTQERR